MSEDYAEVIGDPIAHSLSPVIHQYWLDQLGLPGRYHRRRIAPDALPAYFTSRRNECDWRGCNITIPHKIAALDHVDQVSKAAEALGAINMVVAQDGALHGDNSDHLGVAEALAAVPDGAGHAVLIGAGGAARAALFHLASKGLSCTVVARSPDKAAQLRAIFSPISDIVAMDDGAAIGVAMGRSQLVINASPMGMTGKSGWPEPVLAGLAEMPPGGHVFDMVYAPLDTPLLVAARAQGLETIDGLTMLIGQARHAFQAFFGVLPPPDLDGPLRQRLVG